MSFIILNPEFIPDDISFLPSDTKFVLMRTMGEGVHNDAIVQKLTERAIPGKPVFVKNVDTDTIQRFMKVKNVSNVFDLRPTNLELEIASTLPDLAHAFHSARVQVPDSRSIFSAIMIPLYVFETFRAFLRGERVTYKYIILDMFARKLEQGLEVTFEEELKLRKPSIHLVEIADPGGFHQPSRMNKTEYDTVCAFCEKFSWSTAACIFDLEESVADGFVDSFIDSVPIGESGGGDCVAPSFDSRFLDLPTELRRFLADKTCQGEAIRLNVIDASDAKLQLLYDYVHGRLHSVANNKVDMVYVASQDTEFQHTLIQQYAVENVTMYFEKPDVSTVAIVESFQTSAPVASMYARMFEASRYMKSYTRTEDGGLIVQFAKE